MTENKEVKPLAELKFPTIEYGVTEAEIAEVAERYKEPDASTDEGYEHCKEGVNLLTSMRTALETRRMDLKRPITAWIAENVDGRAKKLKKLIVAAETPVRAEKERVDEVKQAEARKAAELEQARIDGIKENIGRIEATAREQHPSDTSADYQQHITWLTELEIGKDVFGEFVDEAKTVRDAALYKLTQWHKLALEREAADKQRAAEQVEIDRQKKELDEREAEQKEEAARIAKGIQDAVDLQAEIERKEREAEELRVAAIQNRIDELRTAGAYANDAASLRGAIKALENQTPTAEVFAGFLNEALIVRGTRLAELKQQLAETEEREEQERRDEEAKLPDKQKLVLWLTALEVIVNDAPVVINDAVKKVINRYRSDAIKLVESLRKATDKL